jgi:hypothetical protein
MHWAESLGSPGIYDAAAAPNPSEKDAFPLPPQIKCSIAPFAITK